MKSAFAAAGDRLPALGRCLSYLSFSDSDSMVWSGFGYGEVFFPAVELVQTRKGCFLAFYLNPESESSWQKGIKNVLGTLKGIHFQCEEISGADYDLSDSSFSPNMEHWHGVVNKALASFKSDELLKVVLSREVQMQLKGSLNPWLLLQHWQAANPRSYVFAFESSDQQLFLGCSPERLYRRIDRVVHTEALAGTARRGLSRDEDFELESRLLNDVKNVHENYLVLEDIRQRLNKICNSLEFDRTHSVVKLKTVQHLRYLIRGVLSPDISDADLFSTLHPTPAVGGSSRKKAIEFIEANEGYARGLYAGACGILGHEKTEFTVAIRSALLKRDVLSLFSGAGIVKGSDADEEWQELNNKVKTVMNLLGAPVIPSTDLGKGISRFCSKDNAAQKGVASGVHRYVSSQAS